MSWGLNIDSTVSRQLRELDVATQERVLDALEAACADPMGFPVECGEGLYEVTVPDVADSSYVSLTLTLDTPRQMLKVVGLRVLRDDG